MTPPTTTINGLALRKALGRDRFAAPTAFGNGWRLDSHDDNTRVIVTELDAPWVDHVWVHASIGHPDHMPTYDELAALHRAAFGDGWAYQVFAPAPDHVNIHPYALHLWGRADGEPALPNFGLFGTI